MMLAAAAGAAGAGWMAELGSVGLVLIAVVVVLDRMPKIVSTILRRKEDKTAPGTVRDNVEDARRKALLSKLEALNWSDLVHQVDEIHGWLAIEDTEGRRRIYDQSAALGPVIKDLAAAVNGLADLVKDRLPR